jgi:hypothetical protein
MNEADSQDELAREAGELAALVVGREPPATVASLRSLCDRVVAGRLPHPAELALLEQMRSRYGHELSELEHPEA